MHTPSTAGASTRMAGAAWPSFSSSDKGSANSSITPQHTTPSRKNTPAVTRKMRFLWFTRPIASARDTRRERARGSPAVDTISRRLYML